MSANAAESTFPAPDDYAVIVGINRYRPGIDPLRGAVNDANLFYRWVTDASGGGLNPVNVKLIVSPTEGGYEPRVSDIENEIMLFYDRLWNTGRKVGRRLYLFMAGHGIAPPDGNDCSLVSSDSWPNAFWVVTGRLTAERVLRQPMFEEVVLFMACCRDVMGSNLAYSGLPGGGQPLPNAQYLHGLAVKWSKRAIEKELPDPFDPTKTSWQSVFTHSLIKGLRSAVDDAGRITSLSLKNFVKSQVRDLLPPDNNDPPYFESDEDRPPIVFRPAPAGMPGGPFPGSAGPAAPPTPVLRTRGVVGPAPPAPVAPDIASDRQRGSASTALESSGLVPVEVVLTDPAGQFEVLDGADLSKLEPPTERTPEGNVRVFLKPSLYVFRAPGRKPQPARVLAEAIRVSI